jgi:hypothetical protein
MLQRVPMKAYLFYILNLSPRNAVLVGDNHEGPLNEQGKPA